VCFVLLKLVFEIFSYHTSLPLIFTLSTQSVGLYFLFDDLNDGTIFIILYGTIAWYFAGVMVRLMLTLAPIACILAAFGISALLRTMSSAIKLSNAEEAEERRLGLEAPSAPSANTDNESRNARRRREEAHSKPGLPSLVASIVILGITGLLYFYSMHATFVSSEAYSSPSVVLGSKMADGSKR
jgi:dolichyl-diphosphooligosaccharide--protein glycosyltransferase